MATNYPVTCKPPYRIRLHGGCAPEIIGTHCGKDVIIAEVWGRTLPEERAHAEFIVRACNSHEALLDALNWLTHLGHGVGRAGGEPEPGEFETAINNGAAAIAKAKGE